MHRCYGFSLIFLLAVCLYPVTGFSQNQSKVQSVNIEATTQADPASITLNWKADSLATGWIVFRKSPEESGWFQLSGTLTGMQTAYTDDSVQVGNAYEYRIIKLGAQGALGGGYLSSGIQLPPQHFRGRIALVMDQRLKDTLTGALNQFQQDLKGSGWAVEPLYVDTGLSVQAVKDSINQLRNQYPDTLEAALLLGQIPVPYSGGFTNDNVPDGHNDHTGAWPADVFYATDSGAWTDLQAFDTTSRYQRNYNQSRDGKFDPSSLTAVNAEAELMIGRVDLSDLPAFGEGELSLLKRYLRKDHAYRHGKVAVQQRGVVDDNFNFVEGFGQNGYRNFSTMVGKDQVDSGNYQSALTDSSALWTYGAGGGSMTEANGIASTSEFVSDTFRGVFTMIFGSYFGDFDGKNNVMRAALASKGSLLSVSWAGRPHWHYHPMGMGAPLGKAAQLSQNNAAIPPSQSSTYFAGSNAGGTHVALMGDPTLTLYPYQPPQELDHSYLETASGGSDDTTYVPVSLEWKASTPAEGYYIYRYDSARERFSLLTDSLVTDTRYVDTNPVRDTHRYMVRASRLKTSPSGSYYQLSQGIFDTAVNKVNDGSGLAGQREIRQLKAYPNPAQDQVQVTIPEGVQRGSLRLLNVTGKVLAEKPIATNSQTVKLQLGDRAAGTYILRIQGSMKAVAPKRIIVK
jgi:hypothetical protein